LIPDRRIYADEAGGIPHDETPRVHIAARRPVWPLASPRSRAAIGFLKAHRRIHSYFVAAFRRGLREMDEVEDHNVAIECRCVEGQNDRFRRSRRKLVFRAT
jgi:hypothetical protein